VREPVSGLLHIQMNLAECVCQADGLRVHRRIQSGWLRLRMIRDSTLAGSGRSESTDGAFGGAVGCMQTAFRNGNPLDR
jgi:hypothetical protein